MTEMKGTGRVAMIIAILTVVVHTILSAFIYFFAGFVCIAQSEIQKKWE